jgi:hypothetical protein
MDREALRDVDMRFTVHAEQHRGPVEFEFATAIEAISKAWQLMAAGATGLYIYDDETDGAYWPNTFTELHKASIFEVSDPTTPKEPALPQSPQGHP